MTESGKRAVVVHAPRIFTNKDELAGRGGFFYLGPDNKGLPIDWFPGVVVVRDIAVVVLCVFIVREIYRLVRDLVRQAGDDDPCGGSRTARRTAGHYVPSPFVRPSPAPVDNP
ncbi:hypothetical protein [Saccharothrix deserti]|uniref:hypothetical protein n=1 Tax=Saccharothrix deserti TaxID=2593674 RepID=UPI003B75BB8D